jgi:hypothetical protein
MVAVAVPVAPDDDHPDSPALVLTFGDQVDPRPIRHSTPDLPGTGRKLSAAAVANYIVKYATKPLTPPASQPGRSGCEPRSTS